MRFSVRYQSKQKNWAVIDTGVAEQIVGLHATKAAAYKQAFAEQERWRKLDPAVRELTRSRKKNPKGRPPSLVVR